MNKFAFYSDPGHGWLRVPRSELMRLGIAHKITGYSYYRNGWAYLEEDCDASLFMKARAAEDRPISVVYRDSTKTSRIRNYRRYGA